MSSANAFVSHAINSAFIPRPVPLHYIVDGKKKKYSSISKRYLQLRPLASPYGISCEYDRCNNINQQFAYTRLSKIAQIAMTFWLQEKTICIFNMKETCFEVFIWYKREFECFGNVFLNVTCKSRWSRNAPLELKYAYINRSKN